MTNYIEVTHEYYEEETAQNGDVWVDGGADIWYAVSPTPQQWNFYLKSDGADDRPAPEHTHWAIRGTTLNICTKRDIAGLRKLLDAIEIELDKENGAN